jgi:aryl-alcohol dehydrogenase-like predicted oxidoreductase
MMRYKLLGKSGLRVSELCLGTMTFGEDWGWGAPLDESRRMFETYIEAGGNFIDTANYYTEGTAERFVGEFIAAERDRFVVSTKYTLFKRQGDPNACGNQRKNLVQALEASLKQLKTDYIDIYWIHAWDQMTPVEEIMRALDDVVRAGKVLYVGASDTPAWVIAHANTLADLRGWSRFIGLQAPYNLLERELEADIFPMARTLDIGVLTWGPLSSGKLTGKHSEGRTSDSKRMRSVTLTEREAAIIDTVLQIADETGHAPSQVAINWIRQQQHRAQIIPIIGARTLDQFKDNLGCLDFTLTPEQVQRLDAASRIELWFPHDFLAADTPKKLIYGGTYDLIDNHRR